MYFYFRFNNAVKHIKVMKDDMYYLANCKMFHTIPVSDQMSPTDTLYRINNS